MYNKLHRFKYIYIIFVNIYVDTQMELDTH